MLAGLFALSARLRFRDLSPRIGLTRHAGHVYVTAVFLLIA
jgi:hypothetical protein